MILQIAAGWIYANFLEWSLHKYVLHDLGKKGKLFRKHWSRHHRNARKNNFYDKDYEKWFTPEVWEVGGLALLHLPLLPVFPFFTLTIFGCAINYLYKHRKSHLDPEWAKEHMPWHWEHHLGKDQDKNWVVSAYPLWDKLLGTATV